MAVVYYTHNAKPRPFMRRIYERHREQAERLGHQFVAVVRERFRSDDIEQGLRRNGPPYEDLFARVRRGIRAVDGGDDAPVFLVEDDVLYPDEHFQLPDYATERTEYGFDCLRQRVWYNLNVVYMAESGFFDMHKRGAIMLSQMFGTKHAMWNAVTLKWSELWAAHIGRLAGQGFCIEPAGSRGYCTGTHNHFPASVDIRLHNSTWEAPEGIKYRDIEEGWQEHAELWREYCQ